MENNTAQNVKKNKSSITITKITNNAPKKLLQPTTTTPDIQTTNETNEKIQHTTITPDIQTPIKKNKGNSNHFFNLIKKKNTPISSPPNQLNTAYVASPELNLDIAFIKSPDSTLNYNISSPVTKRKMTFLEMLSSPIAATQKFATNLKKTADRSTNIIQSVLKSPMVPSPSLKQKRIIDHFTEQAQAVN